MALATEVLQGRHAVWAYSKQTVKGTPVTPATLIGISALRARSKSGQRAIPVLGAFTPQFIKPGGAAAEVSPSNIILQLKTFLSDCCVRDAAGQLAWFTLACGYRDDDTVPAKWAWQIQDCKVHQFDLGLEAGDGGNPLEFGFQATGGLITEVSTLAPVTDATNVPWAVYEAVLTKGGSPHEARSFRMTVNHNVSVKWVLAGAAPASFKRGWKYQVEGQQAIDGEVQRYVKSGINMQADTLSGSDLVLALTAIGGGGNNMTVTCGTAQYGEEEIAAEIEGDIVYSCPFVAKTLAIA